jgi:hypothetical protein
LEEKFIFNLHTGRSLGTLFVLKSGEFRKKGLVLNPCPFCGEKIYNGREVKP